MKGLTEQMHSWATVSQDAFQAVLHAHESFYRDYFGDVTLWKTRNKRVIGYYRFDTKQFHVNPEMVS